MSELFLYRREGSSFTHYKIKKMKRLSFLHLLGLLFIVLGTVSCEDNEDKDTAPSELMGLWHPIYTEGYEINGGEKRTWSREVANDRARVEFFADGTVKNYEYQGTGWSLRFIANYQVVGDLLVLIGENGENDKATIVSLTSTRLIVATKYIDAGWECYEEITYEKIASNSNNENGGIIDDGNDDENISMLSGLWYPVHSEGYVIAGEEKETWNKDIDLTVDEYALMRFSPDGIFENYMYRPDSNSLECFASGGYKLQEDRLIMFNIDGSFDEMKVVSLESTQLIVEMSDETGEYYEKITYWKVKE